MKILTHVDIAVNYFHFFSGVITVGRVAKFSATIAAQSELKFLTQATNNLSESVGCVYLQSHVHYFIQVPRQKILSMCRLRTKVSTASLPILQYFLVLQPLKLAQKTERNYLKVLKRW